MANTSSDESGSSGSVNNLKTEPIARKKDTPPPPPPWHMQPGSSLSQNQSEVATNETSDPQNTPVHIEKSGVNEPDIQMINTVNASKESTNQVQAQEIQQKQTDEQKSHNEELKTSGFVSLKKGDYTYAGFWKRFAAVFVDGLILGALSTVISLVGNIITTLAFPSPTVPSLTSGTTTLPSVPTQPSGGHMVVSMIISGISFLVIILYPIYFIGSKGQTPGKMIFNIKVIDKKTKQTPGYLSAFLRETIGKFASAIIFFLGYFWMLKDPEKQTLHDKIAGTVVIADVKSN